MMIFGTASLAAGALAMFLPETKGRPLPENTEEALNLPNGVSISHCKRILKPCRNRMIVIRKEDGISSADVSETTGLLDSCSVKYG